MKKYILIFILLFCFYSNTHAIEQEIILWCNTPACSDSITFDITPDTFDTVEYFIYARGDMSASTSEFVTFNIWSDTHTISTWNDSDVFELISSNNPLNITWDSILNLDTLSTNEVNYWPNWMVNYYEIRVLIEYTIEETVDPGTGTGTGTTNIVINNIDNDPWINKEVFDEATLIEIYKYEALMMVFILLYTFFMRVIGARVKKVPKMWI